jgi:hypothetical protein
MAFATVIGVLMPFTASALEITTSGVSFNNTATVTDLQTAGATTNNNASLGSSSISQFNKSVGVLTGATLNLTSTQTQTVQAKSTDGPNNGNNNSTIITGSGTSTSSISAPGVSNTFGSITASDTCTAGRQEACNDGATTSAPAPTNLTGAVAFASLDSYVGGGTVDVTRTATILSATQGPPLFTGISTTKYDVTWAGDVSLTYDYLLHAAPSFDNDSALLTLNLDFGTVFLGDSSSVNFSIFNLADPNRVGLDLDSFLETSDPGSLFSTNLANFLSLAQGESNPFKAFFNASTLGLWSASYSLNLSDADVGAATSRHNYTLLLNLTGNVNQRAPAAPAPIPEPGVLALFGIGLLGLGLGRRKAS